jgi:hypothetical protein
MGKNRKKGRGGRKTEIRYPFKFTFQPLNSSSNGFSGTYLDLSCANLGTRISVVCKQFRKWRFCRSLKVMQYMDTTAMASYSYDVALLAPNALLMSHALGFFGGPESSLSAVPTNMNTIVELMCSDIGPSGRILRITVPLKTLKEAMIAPWHFTTDGGTLPFADATIIGNLQFGTSLGQSLDTGAANVYAVISGEIEFAEPIEPAISMNSWKPKIGPVINVPYPSPILQDLSLSRLGVSSVGDETKTNGDGSESAIELVMMPDEPIERVSPVQTAMSFPLDNMVAGAGRSDGGERQVVPHVITLTKPKSIVVASVERKYPP